MSSETPPRSANQWLAVAAAWQLGLGRHRVNELRSGLDQLQSTLVALRAITPRNEAPFSLVRPLS